VPNQFSDENDDLGRLAKEPECSLRLDGLIALSQASRYEQFFYPYMGGTLFLGLNLIIADFTS
jgi:hypothetical protein